MFKAKQYKEGVLLSGVKDFNITHTFTCGQCFRWNMEADGSFTGVAHNKVLNLKQDHDTIFIDNITLSEYNELWKNYFDFERPYGEIKKGFTEDENLSKAMDFGWGIHILNQDVFECLISFIISTQNQIPRIMSIVEKLSGLYGEKRVYNNKEYYTFPTPQALAKVEEAELFALKTGYRAGYIRDAVSKVLTGEVKLEKLREMPYLEARSELMKIKGVGPKVADCVLLFSCKKTMAFPVDVWVKRTVNNLYLHKEATEKEIFEFSKEYFGEYAGFAQQYLFYYSRENSLK